MLGRLGDLHLKEQVVHHCHDSRHPRAPPSALLIMRYLNFALAFRVRCFHRLGGPPMQQGVVRTTDSGITYSIQPALSLLEKTPILLETMLRDVPPAVLRWKP